MNDKLNIWDENDNKHIEKAQPKSITNSNK